MRIIKVIIGFILTISLFINIMTEDIAISNVGEFPASYANDVFRNLRPYSTAAFKINKVIRTENFIKGVLI